MGRRSLIALCSVLIICGVFVAFKEDASDFSRSSIKAHAEGGKIMNKATKKLVTNIKSAFKKAEHHWNKEGKIQHHGVAKELAKAKSKSTPTKGGRKVADKGVVKDKDKKVVKKAIKKYIKPKKKVSIKHETAKKSKSKKNWGKVVSVKKKAKKKAKKLSKAENKRMKKILKTVKQNKVRAAEPKKLWKGLHSGKIYKGLIKRDLVPAKTLSDPFHCDEEIHGKDCIHINSKGKNKDTGGIKGLPKIINGKVRPPGYTTDDAHTGSSGHYYIGVSRRRIGAGFGRRRRTQDTHRVAKSHHRILVHGGVAKKLRL